MENASPLPLQICSIKSTNHSNNNNPNNNISADKAPIGYSSTTGNEENAQENTDRQQQQQQQQVLKKMRIDRPSFCQLQDNGRRLSNVGGSSSSTFNLNHDVKQVDAGGFLLASSNGSSSPSMDLPLAASSDSTTEACSSISASSHNWLDDYGKQNIGRIGSHYADDQVQQQQDQTSMAATTLSAPAKDPRFHCVRKTQRSQLARVASTSEKAPPSPALFPQDAMEDPQVFLAPVIMRPSMSTPTRIPMMQRHVESPWKESTNGFASPPPMAVCKRPSIVQVSHQVIPVAHEAPELTVCSSQETITSSSHSAVMSHLTSSTTSSMASALVKRIVMDKPTSSAQKDSAKARLFRPAVRGTPVRIKPRVRTQEVQATDQGYASVAKLSAWLADDPTSTKKMKHVRRGANVMSKSRKFEKDMEDVIVEQNNIAKGAVTDKKNWLKSAFGHEGAEDEEEYDHFHPGHDNYNHHHHHDSNRHMMMMRTQPVNLDDDCARSEFVVSNDTASVLSVSNKKQWLQNAFKKEGDSASDIGGGQRRMSFKAQSDIGPPRDSRDEISSRAKQRWQQKSGKRAVPTAAASPYRPERPRLPRDSTPRTMLEEKMRMAMGTTRASCPSPMLAKAAQAARASSNLAAKPPTRHSIHVLQVPVEEDKTPVDFRAARELLIQRSKDNGNEVKLVSKVQSRANKFESIAKDTKRRSSTMGLLKPKWDSNSSTGSDVPLDDSSANHAPSDTYSKSFVEDIAPKRSFEELP